MKTKNKCIAALSVFVTVLALAATSLYGQDAQAAKIERFLTESNMKYSKVRDNIWTVPFQGKQFSDFKVVVVAENGLLLMFVTVAEKNQFRSAPELHRKLLVHNSEFDRVKIGIDKEGAVFVRIDLSVRLVDKQELATDLDQTAAAADEVYASLKPFLNPTK